MYFRFSGHIAISGCRSLSQSLSDTLFWLAMVEKLGLAVGISTLSVAVPVVYLFPVLVAISLFKGCRLMSQSLDDTLCELALVENPRFAVGIVVISTILLKV